MARIALTIGMAALGAGIGVLTGGIGFGLAVGMFAGQLMGSLIFPVKLPNQIGPRLADLTVSGATAGTNIPIGYGTFRLAGCIIWSPGIVEHSKTTHSGKGMPSYSSTTYSYTVSFAVSFGESYGTTPSTRTGRIRKIWFDSKVVFDDTGGTNNSRRPVPRMYPGSETQMPDPLIQGTLGAAACPAYRGLIYAVWENFDITDWGNRVPNVQALIEYGYYPTTAYTLYSSGITFSPGCPYTVTPSEGELAYELGMWAGLFAAGVKFRAHAGGNPTQITVDWYNFTYATLIETDNYSMTGGTTDLIIPPANAKGFNVRSALPGNSDFGNGFLDIYQPVATPGAGKTPLSDVFTDLCLRAGLTTAEIDVSACASIYIGGYVLTSQVDVKSALQNLLAAYFVDVVESDFKLKFIPRGSASTALTIPEADLGIAKDKGSVNEEIPQEQDLPRNVNVLFMDPNIAYQQNSSEQKRHTRAVKTKQLVTMSLPMVLTVSEARAIAEKALYLSYLEGKPFTFNLWKAAYMRIDPTDIIQFTYQGKTYRVRVTTDAVGADYSSKIAAVSEDSNSYLSTPPGADNPGVPPGWADPQAATVLFLFDIPYLQDLDAVADRSHSGYYVGVTSPEVTWPGAVEYKSPDNANFDPIGFSSQRMTYGNVIGTLGDPPVDCWSWDTVNTLVVDRDNGTFVSSTDLAVLNGANPLMVGSELIQYVNAVDNGDGTTTLSRLLRGRRNTEYAAFGHGASELVVDPSTGLSRIQAPLVTIGLLRYYRGVTLGGDISLITSTNLTLAAHDLMPASPVQITGARDGSNNLTLGWTRRTRYAGDWLNNTGSTPLNEDTEAYSIDVMSGVTVLRTIAWTPGTYDGNGNPTAAYSAANQVTDGLTPGNPVTVNIYQISAQVGRGFPGKGTV